MTTTYYFTKWIKAIPTRDETHKVIIGFLEDILSRFGFSTKIVTNNVTTFKAKTVVKFFENICNKLIHSNPYYPQGNGLE
jgi:hypothetical protein